MSPPPAVDCRFLRACRGKNDGRPPMWIMRQAGRYLPEYQRVKRDHSFVEMCTTPEIAVDVSLQPYRRFGFDAVVVFYDILFLPEAMGAPLTFSEAGPSFSRPIRDGRDVDELRTPNFQSLVPGEGTGAVLSTLRELRREVAPEHAVLGFAGAPFTLAAYLVEGNFQRAGERIRRMMNEAPEVLHRLLERLAVATGEYLKLQIDAGADAVQLFDTWASLLSRADYETFALPYTQQIFSTVATAGAPTILYINGCSHLLDSMIASGADALSVDWREPIAVFRQRAGPDIALQGNLDPTALFATPESVRERTCLLLESMSGDPRYIFNLGHGIHRDTPVASVEALVEAVRAQ